MTEQEIFDRLLPLVREVTRVPPERIGMESVLMTDLGAESLDLLDLSFLIEEEFGVTIEADEFEREAVARLGGKLYDADGFFTFEGLAELRRALPEVPAERLTPPLPRVALPAILNVAVFVHLVQRKLAEPGPEARDV